MMGTTHVAFALLCYYIIAYSAGLPFDAPVLLTLLVVGSLLPDIDHPRGFLARQLYLFKRASRGVSRYVTHRGIVHSLLAALIATFAVWVVALFYDLETLAVACFFLGFASHLTADSLNPTGIKWLQPFSKAKLRDGIRTGSAVENLFFFFVIAAIFVIFYVSDVFSELGSLWLWHII
ncbi:metal-dependent hydrolase [Candidatus Bathyarchaeota archaeon]|nr:metal-dependent hydrolase [Candidatus Bathyarchaeota archaeon]